LRLAAGVRRLAVRDTRRTADQPLSRRANSLWILHNGEIFNDAELRRDLCATGMTFSTGNDAETVLAAYEAWGEDCFSRLRGMWAATIVDLTAGKVVLSRDRLGVKPLFYARQNGRTLVASHPRAIARAMAGGPRLNVRRWRNYLRGFPAAAPDDGFFAGIHVVPAGSTISIDLRSSDPQLVPKRYWRLDEVHTAEAAPYDDDEARDELLALLDESTREQMCADRTVGCLLSGGLDSSLVASIAGRVSVATGVPAPICYSIVYDDPRMSEWPYIQAVAAHNRMRVVTHQLTPDEAWTLVDPVVAAQGEPLLGQDSIAQFRAFKLAREHDSIVVLEGQGSDELFAGMAFYEAVMFEEWARTGNWRTLWHEARLRAQAGRRSALPLAVSLALAPTLRRFRISGRYDWIDGESPRVDDSLPGFGEASSDPSRLNRYLFDLTRRTNLPSVLLMQDRMSMAHGVENRPPFLDHRLVEWAFRLPPAGKVGNGKRKRVVWDAARQLLPPLVTSRTDKKAIVSRNDWMALARKFREPLSAMAASRMLRQAPGIDATHMSRFVDRYLRGEHGDDNAIWRLYTGWRWLEQFEPSCG
jgi:asparagine synthase (glutamine-hydrolysing)